ncbi:hypothetical protein AVEN_137572-1 [Araneus ventricosus]|uniref:Uncharacterized protein n=1 Tax=Araneus ventricosus TaxID=182803 RepID=A0A4Y2M8U6_ARAVE|nr:hypothetical protein AVEN_137572-1 [Araneus ventricosus]
MGIGDLSGYKSNSEEEVSAPSLFRHSKGYEGFDGKFEYSLYTLGMGRWNLLVTSPNSEEEVSALFSIPGIPKDTGFDGKLK